MNGTVDENLGRRVDRWQKRKNCLCQLFTGQWPEAHIPGRVLMARGYAPHPDYGDDPTTGTGEGGTHEEANGYAEFPQDAADPLTGGYTSPLTLTRYSAMVEESPSEAMAGVPFERRWELHVPTDRVTPQFPALALARGLQQVDPWTPITDWQHSYGYLEISDTQTPALESPRYSYAAIDTQDLLDEARARVMRTL